MSISIHQGIRVLIEQTSDAFSNYDSVNADYAEFATLAVSDFRAALKNPALTRSQLARMLRRGMIGHWDRDSDSWASFMAQHIAGAANTDSPEQDIKENA